MTTRTDYHTDTSREFLARARTYLAEDDLLQASEKGWGAAAQMVKATAESRGWRHRTHRDLYVAIEQLVAEAGDEGIGAAFGLANELHQNFYEGLLPRRAVERNLDAVAELVEKLDALKA